jgi:hypothetical protein
MDMNTVFIGIDPGVSGAIACVAPGQVWVADAPTIETRGSRREYMLPEMRRLLTGPLYYPYDEGPLEIHHREDGVIESIGASKKFTIYAVVEDVNPMPREGVVSAGAFMRGVGLWEGLLAGLGIPFSKVRPQVWKKEFGIALPPATPPKSGKPKDQKAHEAERRKRQIDQKARAIIVAQRLFPSVSLARKKDHGRAEALLIAEFARRHWTNTVPGPPNPKALRPE